MVCGYEAVGPTSQLDIGSISAWGLSALVLGRVAVAKNYFV